MTYKKLFAALILFAITIGAHAQNPLIRNNFSADPTARVFGNKVYIYPSHDILAQEGKGRIGWFCMEDYHVYSSQNLTTWEDHGVIVTQNKVPWVRPNSYSMWAPDCIEKNGKYYFYFPTAPADTVKYGRGFRIGVAVANKPEGPFISLDTPIANVRGIDPNVFIDKDGQAYLYWSQGNIFAAKLKDNMVELDGEVKMLENLPTKGLKEGPYLFEQNGLYYLTYPHVENKIERLEYAIGNNPLGPFKFTGVIMDESPTGCWTNHHSIINFKNQWYLFYHHNDYSPNFDKARSIRADSLFFNADGTIKKVVPTMRGIGVTLATENIELDRYSAISASGTTIEFLDTTNTFLGWQTMLQAKDAWVQYNAVNFTNSIKSLAIHGKSDTGGTLLVKTTTGILIATVKIPATKSFTTIKVPVKNKLKGSYNLIVSSKYANTVAVDYLKFQ